MSNKGVEDFYSDKLLKEFTLVSSKHAAKSVHIHYMYNGIIPESAVDNLQVSQTASASGVPPLSLSAPVILSFALLRVTTLPAGGLLQVVGFGPTPAAQGVRLVPALSKR